MNKRYFVLIIIVILIVGAIFYLEKDKVNPVNIGSTRQEVIFGENEVMLKDGKYPKAPELAGIADYLNTNGEKMKISDFEGKVVLVDFWTYTCINCIRTLPFLKSWYEKYRDKGLVIIGVHTPEFEFEKERINVENAIEKYGIEYAVVQDNDYATWQAYQNRFWPRKYLIDSEGYIRYDHIGEGAYEETELKIQELLAEIGEDVSGMKTEEEGTGIVLSTTSELYAGYDFALGRGQNTGNQDGLQPEQTILYKVPESLDRNVIYLDGIWKSNPDDLELIGEEGSVFLHFTAKEVNIVADATDESLDIQIFIDGDSINTIEIDKPQLYNVYNGKYGNYLLELKVKRGFSFNAFTFGG
jgi:thiol-disulfide isomerase/thioredoxin